MWVRGKNGTVTNLRQWPIPRHNTAVTRSQSRSRLPAFMGVQCKYRCEPPLHKLPQSTEGVNPILCCVLSYEPDFEWMPAWRCEAVRRLCPASASSVMIWSLRPNKCA